jgi:hypothetical protein
MMKAKHMKLLFVELFPPILVCPSILGGSSIFSSVHVLFALNVRHQISEAFKITRKITAFYVLCIKRTSELSDIKQALCKINMNLLP